MKNKNHLYNRRDILKVGAASTMVPWFPGSVIAASQERQNYYLSAARAGVQLANDPFPKTEVWSFNNESPGPLLRLRQGELARIKVKNELEQPLTVYWHGRDNYNHERYHESLDNITPANMYFGRYQEIMDRRTVIKYETLQQRSKENLRICVNQ